MLAISSLVKIYLHAEPVDMRKSFDGLFGIIKSDLHLDVRDGGVFMFLSGIDLSSIKKRKRYVAPNPLHQEPKVAS